MTEGDIANMATFQLAEPEMWGFKLAEPMMWDFHFKGLGTLKWVDDHYEFEGDPHESAKVFAEYLASELNGRLK